MDNRILIPVAFASLGIAALIVATPVNAKDIIVSETIVPTRVVSYADLNIYSQDGQQRLLNRLKAASKSVCIEAGIIPTDKVDFMAYGKCYAKAMKEAKTQYNEVISQPSTVALTKR